MNAPYLVRKGCRLGLHSLDKASDFLIFILFNIVLIRPWYIESIWYIIYCAYASIVICEHIMVTQK